MKKSLFITLISACIAVTISNAQQPARTPLSLWYEHPAQVWEEALPLGNAHTGAMVFGRVNLERVQLNNSTLWSGYPDPGNNPKGAAALPLVRQAVSDGDYRKAEELWKKNLQGPYSARYLTMADLFLDFGLKDSTTRFYQRQLDLNQALNVLKYKIGNVTYTREALVSYPDKVFVMRITADKPHSISFSTGIKSKLRYAVSAPAANYLVLSGKAPKHVAHRESEPQQIVYDDKEGMTFQVHVQLKTEGGKTSTNGKQIKVTGANAVTIYLTSATSFNGFDKSPGLEGKDPSVEAKAAMKKAWPKSYAAIKAAHVADYQRLFKRVSFTLQSDPKLEALPTDVRLSRHGANGNDQGLQTLYFQYGRYLMISSSRPGSLPSNLQGIWNDHVQPPWGSNFTTNANTQMNYWPAENTNLSELHQPLFDFMARLAVNGSKTIKINYGIDKGWTVHHNTDIWAKTSPTGGYDWDPRGAPRWSAWPMGGPWLATHLFEHYLYTGDKEFLRNKAYPLMKGAAEFVLNWLQEDKESGYLVTNPSTSPENVFKLNGKQYQISMATTMDMAIIKELLNDCISASEALNIDPDFRAKLTKTESRLYPYHIGKYGQLQEWFKDWDDPKDTHRHLSHLFGLFPGNQITIKYTPELAAAAKQSLIHRGDVSTGWSMAWKINWWSRLHDGDHALKILKNGLTLIDPVKRFQEPDTSKGQLTNFQMSGGGTYPNLFDAHPPFQIDGNFGATAGMVEMLMQSHTGSIQLLPALPKEWTTGAIKGIKARGNFTIDMQWKDNKLRAATIFSGSGGNCRISTDIPVEVVGAVSSPAQGDNPNPLYVPFKTLNYQKDQNATLQQVPDPQKYVIDFKTEKGKQYHIRPL